MERLRYTLVADGISDRALLPVLRWLLVERYPVRMPVEDRFADLRHLPRPPKGLEGRLRESLKLYPCDLLFVHRDAEREPLSVRKVEISRALNDLADVAQPPTVCVIPVRMQEAWLLFDEQAIRSAAGNPNGRQALELPRLSVVESLPDPKKVLYNLLRKASGLPTRRLRRFPAVSRAQQVGSHIDDFTPLFKLSAFRHLASELKETMTSNNWGFP